MWWLLRKLNNFCIESESAETRKDHWKKTGHGYSSIFSEQEFLTKISGGNQKKRIIYEGLLSIADNKMHLLSTKQDHLPCQDCGCLTGPDTKWIRLNSDGLEFIGVFDLTEYILSTYKLTWTFMALPIATLVIGLNWKDIAGYIMGILHIG